ncbi:MAG: hypothetical protein L6Q92_02910 [Phycisphaerae bacterium]|nr:hypothetical protein [Phycisphaerae bacterium]
MPLRNGVRPRMGESEETLALQRDEILALRRRVRFWRSAVGLILLGALLGTSVYYVRRVALRDRCRAALEYFAAAGERVHLEETPPAALELQWQNIDRGPHNVLPSHFEVFVTNWARQPATNEEIPLAVCAETHGVFCSEGRLVLFRTPGATVVRWVEEDVARGLAEQARRSAETLGATHEAEKLR